MAESIISSVAGSLALSKEDQDCIRLAANDPDKVEEIVAQSVEKHEVLNPDK